MNGKRERKILITGASIAGPPLAYWLDRYGFDVTLVERSPTIRMGGYAIDIRGTALEVVERMGVASRVRAEHVNTRLLRIVNDKGAEVCRITPKNLGGSGKGDVELARGALTSIFYDLTRDSIKYRFQDSITSLENGPTSVDVAFRSGRQEAFDLVISAEGQHSSTRALIFGPEEQFSRYLGYCFGICAIPNTFGLRREAVIYNKPGKAAILYSTNDEPNIFVLFAFRRPPPSHEELAERQLQHQSLETAFAGDGWEVPKMLAGAREAEDFYFDSTAQIRMPTWSMGRVALVGDSAFGPSFFTGQGTSMALVGAYVLAGALATHADYTTAFAAYEQTTRPYMLANQAIVKEGSTMVAPGSAVQLWLRNTLFRLAPLISRLGLAGPGSLKAYNCLDLPEYDPALSSNL